MLELILVRHGESESNRAGTFGGHSPARLTEHGRKQAAATARAILSDNVAPRAIYSSDLARAVETCEPLGRACGVAPVVTAALRERAVGDFTGLGFDDVAARFPTEWAALLAGDVDVAPPGGGESHRACRDRAAAFLDELVARHPEGRVVCVSHAVALEHLVRHLLGIPDDRPLVTRISTDNCGLHRVTLRGARARVHALNDTRHLVGV